MAKSKNKYKVKPAKKTGDAKNEVAVTKNQVVAKSSSVSHSIFKDSPIYELLHYFEKAPDQWAARYIIIMSAIILRAAIGLGGFSGQGKPPMHGDFEAQRHWMELTIHLPISEWYYFDLQYWGLDYPPLTAFHSYILGKIGSFLNPEWFAFNQSRGIETNEVKTFMRISSLISELIFYFPAVLTITNYLGKKFNLNRMDQMIILVIITFQSHLILIDHGHFQFNSVMLGLFVYSLINLLKQNYVTASIWFICCINFKQMGLYYSTFIFVFILSQLRSFTHLVVVGLTVVLTNAAILVPFLRDPKSILQIVIRVFPFNRGLFEDKVANFWCTTNVIVKYKSLIDASQLSKLSLFTTVAAILPMNVNLFYKLRNNPKNIAPGLLWGFAGNSFAFYLFSYQVHEKSILIPLLPSTFLILIEPELVDVIQWINNVGTFSLYPLLKKDGLVLQYVISNFLINWLIGPKLLFKNSGLLWNLIIKGTYVLMIVYHIIDWRFSPPARYPDLWVILNIAISFVGFITFWLFLNYRVYKISK